MQSLWIKAAVTSNKGGSLLGFQIDEATHCLWHSYHANCGESPHQWLMGLIVFRYTTVWKWDVLDNARDHMRDLLTKFKRNKACLIQGACRQSLGLYIFNCSIVYSRAPNLPSETCQQRHKRVNKGTNWGSVRFLPCSILHWENRFCALTLLQQLRTLYWTGAHVAV